MKKIKYKVENGTTPFSNKNPFRDENICLLVKEKNKEVEIIKIEDIVKSKRKRILITMKCKCGKIFTKLLDGITREGRNLECKECYSKSRPKKRMKNLAKERIKFIESLGYELLEDLEYFSNTEMLLLKDKNGYIGRTTYSSLKRGSDMTIFSTSINKDNFIYNANVYCKNNGLKTKVICFSNEEKWTRQGIKCQCECGNYFETSICSFMHSKNRCDKCSNRISRWAKSVEDFLIENKIEFIKEFSFNDCRDVLPLPFDYYIKQNNSLIEVDGEQHESKDKYKFVKTEEEKQYWFEKQKYHENIKNEYCKEKGISLLRIDYKDILNNSYKDKIIQFIKE